jgi:Na+-translocating ferredoxin:NAD+ oxidoreductase RnfA subunit
MMFGSPHEFLSMMHATVLAFITPLFLISAMELQYIRRMIFVHGVIGALYIHQVLRPHMVTFIARHRNYTFQHDNIRAHFARATIDFLQQNDMDVIPWPVLSPCLSLIEHLCCDIQRLIESLHTMMFGSLHEYLSMMHATVLAFITPLFLPSAMELQYMRRMIFVHC